MSSSSEHPIQVARREWLDGYRAYLGRTHYLMKDLQAQAPDQVDEPDEEVVEDPDYAGTLYETATEDLPDLGRADVGDFSVTAPLTEDEYRALEFGDDGLAAA